MNYKMGLGYKPSCICKIKEPYGLVTLFFGLLRYRFRLGCGVQGDLRSGL